MPPKLLNLVRWAVAGYLLLIAVATVVHLIITPFYQPDHDPDFTWWKAFDPFMVAGALLVVITAYLWKRAYKASGDDDLITDLKLTVLFYVGGANAIILVWSWLMITWGDPNQTQATLWLLVDSVGPMLALAAGRRLWREARAANA